MAEQPQAFVYDAIRTPRGKGKKNGSLHEVKPVDLVVGLLDEVRKRNPNLDPDRVDDVVLGVVTPIGDQGGDIAKTAALAAGYPETVAGVQLNRFCASGLEAVNQAAMRVRSGFEDLILAGGVESMSRVPMGSDGGAWAMDPRTALDTSLRPAGHRRRPDRHPRGLEPQRRRRVRRRVAGPRGQGAGQRLLRRLGDPGQGPQRRDRAGEGRVHPARHHRGEPRRPQAVVRADRRPGRLRLGGAGEVPLGRADRPRPPRRQLQRHRRRRRARARRHRAGRRRPRPHPAGPDARDRGLRRRPDDHADRPRRPPPARRWPRPGSPSTTSTCSR